MPSEAYLVGNVLDAYNASDWPGRRGRLARLGAAAGRLAMLATEDADRRFWTRVGDMLWGATMVSVPR